MLKNKLTQCLFLGGLIFGALALGAGSAAYTFKIPTTDIQPNDCEPACLRYLSIWYNTSTVPYAEWKKACNTDSKGSDLVKMDTAWDMFCPDSRLTCIFTLEPDGKDEVSNSLQQIRELFHYKDRDLKDNQIYLWIGFHPNAVDPTEPHAALVMFEFGGGIHMIHPNVIKDGKIYEETFPGDAKYFFQHTIAIFQVDKI